MIFLQHSTEPLHGATGAAKQTTGPGHGGVEEIHGAVAFSQQFMSTRHCTLLRTNASINSIQYSMNAAQQSMPENDRN